jgi:hypothetical protein
MEFEVLLSIGYKRISLRQKLLQQSFNDQLNVLSTVENAQDFHRIFVNSKQNRHSTFKAHDSKTRNFCCNGGSPVWSRCQGTTRRINPLNVIHRSIAAEAMLKVPIQCDEITPGSWPKLNSVCLHGTELVFPL